jgi:hypothetical protein
LALGVDAAARYHCAPRDRNHEEKPLQTGAEIDAQQMEQGG